MPLLSICCQLHPHCMHLMLGWHLPVWLEHLSRQRCRVYLLSRARRIGPCNTMPGGLTAVAQTSALDVLVANMELACGRLGPRTQL